MHASSESSYRIASISNTGEPQKLPAKLIIKLNPDFLISQLDIVLSIQGLSEERLISSHKPIKTIM